MSVDARLPPKENINLIYIVGRGHSGSTLLEMLLARHSKIIGLGELKWFSNKKRARVNILEKECTCGTVPLAECEFWNSVAVELESHHRLSLDSLDLDSPDDYTFIHHNTALLTSIKRATGQSYLVDSSKDANRLERLCTLCESIRVLPVYVARNPYGVVYSHVKRGRELRLWAKKYKAYSLEIQSLLKNRQFHFVEYEKLTIKPRETMKILMNYIGLEVEEKQLNGGEKSHHNIGGNDIRFKTNFEIVPDEAWRKKLNLMQKLSIFWYTYSKRNFAFRLRKNTL